MGSVDLCPCLDHGEDLCGSEVGEGEVVGGREGQDVTFAFYRLGAEKDGGEVCCMLASKIVLEKESVAYRLNLPLMVCILLAPPLQHYNH